MPVGEERWLPLPGVLSQPHALSGLIQAAIENGTTPTKKALLQALVQEITVEGRHATQPVFRVPDRGR